MYNSNSTPLNGRPLSLFRTSGMLWRENIASNFERTVFAETVMSTSTLENRLNSSITSRRYSPAGKGPRKSFVTSFQCADGSWVILSGLGEGLLPKVGSLAREAIPNGFLYHLVNVRKPASGVNVWF